MPSGHFDADPRRIQVGSKRIQIPTNTHLLIALLDGKFNPITLDINVSFLGPSHPGKLICYARVLKLGKSIVYLASELYQKEKLVATSTSTVKLVPASI